MSRTVTTHAGTTHAVARVWDTEGSGWITTNVTTLCGMGTNGTTGARHPMRVATLGEDATAVTCKRCTHALATEAPAAPVLPDFYGKPIDTPNGHRWAGPARPAPLTAVHVDPLDMPAASGRVVQQRHADYCSEHGHATHTVDGERSPLCPRCGDPVAPSFRAAPGSARALAVRAALGADPVDVSTVTVSPSRQAELADVYASLPELGHMLDDTARETERAYDALAAETVDQWNAVRAAGVAIIVQDVDPYATAAELIADVENNATLRVWDTAQTGSHPYLSDELNNMFRAVHDFFGHAATGRAFDRHGEEAAYIAHASMFSVTARRALASETRGQNAQVVALGDFSGPQRVALLPAEWCTVDALVPAADELPGTLSQAARNHAQHGLTTV